MNILYIQKAVDIVLWTVLLGGILLYILLGFQQEKLLKLKIEITFKLVGGLLVFSILVIGPFHLPITWLSDVFHRRLYMSGAFILADAIMLVCWYYNRRRLQNHLSSHPSGAPES